MNDNLAHLLDLALGAVKDYAADDALRRVQQAQHEYLLVEAEAGRQKGAAAVKAIAKLDQEAKLLEVQYRKIEPTLLPEAQQIFQRIFHELERQRKKVVKEKKNLSRGA